jgi:hypothetical protein
MSSNDEEEVIFCEFISRPEGKPIFKLILVIIVIIILFFVIILISANTDVIWLVIKIICLIIFYVSIIYVIIWYKKRKILQGEGIVCEEEGQQIIISLARSEKPKTVKTAVKTTTATKKETKKIGKKEQQKESEIPPSEAEVKYDVNFFQSGLICYALSAIGIFCCLDAFTDKIDQLTGGNIGVKFNNTEQIFQFLEGGKDDFFRNYKSSWELLKRRTNFDLSLNLMFFTIKELYYYGNANYRDNLKQVFESVTGKSCFEDIKDVLLNSMKILREDPESVRKEIKDVMKFFPTLVQLFTEGAITCGNINDSLYLLTSFLLNTYSIHEISNFFASLKRGNEPEILFEVQFQTEEDLKQRGVQDFLANGDSFATLYEKHKRYLKSADKGRRLAEEVKDGYYYLFGFTASSSRVLESDLEKSKKESEQKLEGLYKKLRY